MKYFMITGTSRGIGESLAKLLLQDGYHIISIARNDNPMLMEASKQDGGRLSHYSFDLNDIHGIDGLFDELFDKIKQDTGLEGIYLINNAGVLSPVAPIERVQTAGLIENLNVNLIAPMIITSSFIRHSSDLPVEKRIMNISSGSAKYLLPSQSCYSTSKAGLDSFTKSVSLEQSGQLHPVKVVSVYPGMIDTALQTEIRSASREDFPYVDQFIDIAQQGMLQSPDNTAAKLLDVLLSDDFGSTVVIEQLESVS